jgi:hypothetical protein
LAVTRTFRGLGLALALTSLLLVGAAPASAGILVQSAEDCDPKPTQKVFLPWLDPLNYVPVDGGDFEGSMNGWELSGARVVDGNEPFRVAGADDSRSLSLPAGASATTPVMCAGLDHLVMRYFARSSKPSLLGALTSRLRVDVLVETSTGAVLALPLGTQLVTPSWAPSLPVPVVANLLPLLPGEHTPVAFRFTAEGSASWTIDDVYLDPRFRG